MVTKAAGLAVEGVRESGRRGAGFGALSPFLLYLIGKITQILAVEQADFCL